MELNAQLEDARKELALLQAEQKIPPLRVFLDKVIKEEKIPPAVRVEYRAFCGFEGGMEHFQVLVEKLFILASTSLYFGTREKAVAPKRQIFL